MTPTNDKQKESKDEIPSVIATRTAGLEPLLRAWRNKHRGVSWSKLIDAGLKKELAPLAGKKLAHLVDATPQ